MRKNDIFIKEIIPNIQDEVLDQLYIYYQLLLETSKVMNLTTITEIEEVYIKHFYDSLLLSKVVTLNNQNILDVGTGAGFPGLVVAICFPNTSVTLVEPTKKRCLFLEKVINTLNLKNVKIINERAEKLEESFRESFDITTARAVSNLSILLELLTPYTKVNGLVVPLKGQSYKEELDLSINAIKSLSLKLEDIYEFTLPNDLGKRAILVLKKQKPTSNIYPREYAKIKNKPL